MIHFPLRRHGLVFALLLVGTAASAQANPGEACSALTEARGHLVNMLGATDKAALDDLKGKVHASSDKLDGILAAMEKGADAAKAAEFKPVWAEFKNTRETGIIPAVYAGKTDEAKGLASGIQAERMKKMRGTMGCQ